MRHEFLKNGFIEIISGYFIDCVLRVLRQAGFRDYHCLLAWRQILRLKKKRRFLVNTTQLWDESLWELLHFILCLQAMVIPKPRLKLLLTECPNGKVSNTACKSPGSLAKVEGMCNYHSKCELRATNKVFGDPCGGILKYLDVTYTCVERGKIDIIFSLYFILYTYTFFVRKSGFALIPYR